MPAASIIMTTYNHRWYIAEAIQSIVDQDFMDWELLIGDDSPNDETRTIIQSFLSDHRIRAWHHSPSKHIVGNTNFLIDQTDKDSAYLAFLEWDDIRRPNYLSSKLQVFKKFPNVWLVYNEFSIINEKSETIEKRWIAPRTRKRYKNETDTIWDLIASDVVCFWYSTLMSRKFKWIKIHNWWNKQLMWSESDFWLQIANRCNIYGIEDSLTSYRKHSNNTSRNLDSTIKDFEFFVEKYYDDWLIDRENFKKIHILIYMMKCFNDLSKRRFSKFLIHFRVCLNTSLMETIKLLYRSIYYRMIKPYIYKIF